MKFLFVCFLGLITIVVIGAAGSDGSSSSPTASPTTCLAVPTVLVDGIQEGLTVHGGGWLTDAQAVRSGDFSQVYFVSARINGPGLDGPVGTWATNDLQAGSVGGVIFAVDALANEFSDWGDGRQGTAELSMSDHGARQSQTCVRG